MPLLTEDQNTPTLADVEPYSAPAPSVPATAPTVNTAEFKPTNISQPSTTPEYKAPEP